MRTRDTTFANQVKDRLIEFDTVTPLPGIGNPQNLSCLVQQIVDSVRRIKYVTLIRDREIGDLCIDPHNEAFNPIKAASWHIQHGNINEAYWLVFLITVFGKNKYTGWALLKAVYGNLGQPGVNDWETVTNDPITFLEWVANHESELKATGKFGNHRKYENLRVTGTGAAIMSYIDWVGPTYDHRLKFHNVLLGCENNPRAKFNRLYNSLNAVFRFGRMGKFDYLTMVGKLNLVSIEPGSVFMQGATGPYDGACLLLTGDETTKLSRVVVNQLLSDLEAYLNIPFGMQVLEDAICNWQKSPADYEYFNG